MSIKTIVKMGNASDINGAVVAEAIILREEENFGTIYYLVTPMGIALAGKIIDQEPVEYMYSTHCMPLNYSKWILNSWNIEITPEIEEMVKGLRVIEKGIKNDTVAEELAEHAQRKLTDCLAAKA